LLQQQFVNVSKELFDEKEAWGIDQHGYSFTMRDVTRSSTPRGLKEFQLGVSWKSGRKDQGLSVTTYLWDFEKSYEQK
jgi:hypothetical protein